MMSVLCRLPLLLVLIGLAALSLAAPALAEDDWWPHPGSARWTYTWTDSSYSPRPTREDVTACSPSVLSFPCPLSPWSEPPGGFILGWASGGPAYYAGCGTNYATQDSGWMSLQDQSFGVVETNWCSTPAPSQMPILCASSSSSCPNSLAGALYNIAWGSSSPVLEEPLLQNSEWGGSGDGDKNAPVSSVNRYRGFSRVVVPAFPNGVLAAVVESTITQAGALGDPYGSGTRFTWWVNGVGPVRVRFEHTGGAVTDVVLDSTDLRPLPAQPDGNYFPLTLGVGGTYRWTNSRHLPQPEVEKLAITKVLNRTAELDVRSVSGPIRVAGAYGFSLSADGLATLWATTRHASLVTLPPLANPRQYFVTPVDLMIYGFNPILPEYPDTGSSWSGGAGGIDYQTYRATGTTTIVGIANVRVPAGRFRTLEVRTILHSRGHPWGSGVRTVWFSPQRGLVKLEFRHGDGSVSVVELLR